MGPRGGDTIGRRGPGPGRAALWCRHPFDPPAPPLRLFKAPASKTLTEEATIRKTLQRRRRRESHLGG